jgi:two-component system cell cycle response regulator
MMDLDDLKLINDTHGHMAGDRVLQDVATALAKSIRRGDSVGRYGGDEFVALLPSTDAAGALPIVERIREAVSNLTWPKEDGSFAPVSMSYGVSVYPHCGLDATELLAAADANLYRSKRLGGDRITLPPRHSKTDRTARLSPLLRLPTASGDQ